MNRSRLPIRSMARARRFLARPRRTSARPHWAESIISLRSLNRLITRQMEFDTVEMTAQTLNANNRSAGRAPTRALHAACYVLAQGCLIKGIMTETHLSGFIHSNRHLTSHHTHTLFLSLSFTHTHTHQRSSRRLPSPWRLRHRSSPRQMRHSRGARGTVKQPGSDSTTHGGGHVTFLVEPRGCGQCQGDPVAGDCW